MLRDMGKQNADMEEGKFNGYREEKRRIWIARRRLVQECVCSGRTRGVWLLVGDRLQREQPAR